MEVNHQDHAARQQTHLMDFDDGVLLQVLKHLTPLPDLFNVAQACWRFRQLTSDKRMWLLVAPAQLRPDQTPSGRSSGPVYHSLASAVACSRPGDTIWLAPGMAHSVADVRVQFPIHLRGGGLRPEDTMLTCPKGAESAIDFAATAKLANLSITSHMAPCVLHRRGGLRVERCVLQCRADGLEHLLAPLVTVAANAVAAGHGAAAPAVGLRTMLLGPPSVPLPLAPAATPLQPARTQPGIGRLSVIESRLEGGSRAVQCCGTGRLMSVRVIYEAHAAFFWLEVDSAVPGHYESGATQLKPCIKAEAMGVTVAQMPHIKQQPPQQSQAGLGVFTEQESEQEQAAPTCGSLPVSAADADVPCAAQQQCSERRGSGVDASITHAAGLARIQAVLGKRINPDVLSTHLQSRSVRQRGPEAAAVQVKREPQS